MNKKIIFFLCFILYFLFILHKQGLIAMRVLQESCALESFADPKMQKILRTQFLWETLEKKGRLYPSQEDYIDLCLGGKLFKAIDRAGAGEEGEVYKIIDSEGNKFALKIYVSAYRNRQQGDLLAMEKTRESRAFINVPIIVNTQYGYSIFPYLAWPYKIKPDYTMLQEFIRKLDKALAADGLRIGDNWNESNYMYDENYRLWRIDLGSLKEISA